MTPNKETITMKKSVLVWHQEAPLNEILEILQENNQGDYFLESPYDDLSEYDRTEFDMWINDQYHIENDDYDPSF